MRECENCGASVSSDFARVFAGNDGVVHACGECATGRELFGGSAAGLSPRSVESFFGH